MKSRHARWPVATLAALLSFAIAGLAQANTGIDAGHENQKTSAPIVASNECPEPRRVAPKPTPRPKPDTEPARDRPPSSLPCCRGADCTCSGPPALAAAPVGKSDDDLARPARSSASARIRAA